MENFAVTVNIQKKLAFFDLNASFNLPANQILFLWGPSGSGKSTVLKSIAGLIKPDTGQICLNGQAVFDSQVKLNIKPRNRIIGYVFQDYALFPHMTVAQNVAYGLPKNDTHGIPFWLKSSGIEQLANRYPSQISGGERQRVAIARALACGPKVILMDEPFAALDYQSKLQLRQKIKEIHTAWQIPFIIVSHDQEDADFLADQIIYLNQGQTSLNPS